MFSFIQNEADGENSYRLVSALFLRLMAVVYFIAFYSIESQIIGLVGEQGILPLSPWLEYLLGEHGLFAFVSFPSLFWIDSSDIALQWSAWIGCGLSLLLLFNVLPRLNLVLLFVLYLSLVQAGQTFMHFQWDGLLLEAGFLAVFLRPDSRILVFLFRWLLFRLRFMSGISKLVMGDPSWLGMTALIYYFETQPLAHGGAWYFHNLPQWVLIVATGLVLIVEILVPLMMFLPRQYRLFAAWVTLLLQFLILISSNHNWFNLLTIFLCLFLFDDKSLKTILPLSVRDWLLDPHQKTMATSRTPARQAGIRVMAIVIFFAGVLNIYRLAADNYSDGVLDRGLDVLQQWRIVNTFHVFPTMTTRQIELKIEGSIDGKEWRSYDFRYRPNDPLERPQVVIPHHPRLDWMMWFVPMHPKFLNWFDSLLVGLLENSPSVVGLFNNNPFPDQPPNFIRVQSWQYKLTSVEQRGKTGAWWTREYLGLFSPLPGKYRLADGDEIDRHEKTSNH